jgi:hypothetical protein
LTLPGLEPKLSVVQPVASRYTDCAIPAHMFQVVDLLIVDTMSMQFIYKQLRTFGMHDFWLGLHHSIGIYKHQCPSHTSWQYPTYDYDGEILVVLLMVNALRLLVAGFPRRRPGFKPGSGRVGFRDGQKWRWGRFSPRTSVSPANLHSICFSTIIFTITRGWHNRPGVAAVPIVSQTK